MADTSVKICDIKFKNPVMTASGTFGCGREYSDFVDLNKLGGIVVKGVADKPWKGNPAPRIAEVYGGMLNSVGLQNPGVDYFIKNEIPFLNSLDTNIIVNVCGHSLEEYVNVVTALRGQDVDMLELNISCPNVSEGGLAFGTDPKLVEKVVSSVKQVADRPLIVKLTPNVTDITEIARAAVAGGADALSLINTLTGMKIDINRRKPVLDRKVGGMSGPAVKPVAVRMVYQVAKAVDVPIIGMGGISNAEDAIEFIMAGATGVSIGTANFINPTATIDTIKGIEEFMDKNNIKTLDEIRGIIDKMKRFLALGMALAMVLCSLTGCNTSHKVNAAIQENISTLDNKLANLEVTVGDLYQEGIATDEMKDEVDDLQQELSEARDMFAATTDGEQDANISSKLIDLTSKADELEGQVQDALGGIGNVENYAKAMKKVTSELESAIKTAVDNGKMDRSKLTEFQNASSKLDAIVSNPEETTTNKAELLKIRESLVALASEASASNEVIDGLAQNDKKTAQPTVKSEDLTSLVNAYTTLQNTASQLYEKGNITEKSK